MSAAPGSEEASTNPITENAPTLNILSHPHNSQPTSPNTSTKPASASSSPTLDGTASTGSTTQNPSETAAGRSGDDGGDEANDALRWKPRPRLGSGQADTSRPAVKISKAKQGWGNFPLSLLHSVFSYALTTITVDPRVNDVCGDAHDIALALAQRVWLCDMRTVCSGWRTAVDSHSFWPAYTLVLDPSRQHQSTMDDLTSSTLTPSTPSFPTLFHRARSTTLSTCLACKLNHPERLGFYPANPKKITPTSKFGWAPTCNAHWSNFCIGCMMEQTNFKGTDIRNTRIYQVLAVFEETDTDEYGRTRPWTRHSKLCGDCRDAAILREIDVWLKLCARGGVVRGLGRIDFTKTMAYTEYTSGAYGRARPAAYHTIERVWLMDHTRWNELHSAAQSLQSNAKLIKRVYINSGHTESESNMAYRHSLMQELRGDDTAVDIRKDEATMNAMYKSWNKMLVEGDLDEEDDDSDDDEEDEVSSLIEGHLSDYWIDQLRDGAINDWLMDRVRLGFWITVSHEVLHLRQGRFAPAISVHAKDYQHVFPGPVSTWSFSATPRDGMAECLGIVGLHERGISQHATAQPFLPPPRLVHEMDNLFLAKLRERLMPALATLASTVQDEVEDEEDAEEVCRSMGFEEVMAWMRSPESWIRNESRRRLRRLAEERERTAATATATAAETPNTSSDAGGSTVDSESTSPRVELVVDDEQAHEGDESYAIQIERGSEGAWEEDPPRLGKRKSPPTSDEDVGERKSKQGSGASDASPSSSSSSPTSSSKTPSDPGDINTDAADIVKAPVVPRGQTPATATGSDGASSAASPKAGDLVSTTRSSSESGTIPITPDEDMGAALEAPSLDGKSHLKSEVGAVNQAGTERTDREMPDLGADDSVGATADADVLGSQRQVVAVLPVPARLSNEVPTSKTQADSALQRRTPPSKSIATLSGTDLIATLTVDALEPLLHTPIELIPYIPKTDLAASDNVVEATIMEAWHDSRAGLRECRCGICARGKALEREARSLASLWLAGVEAERERVMANGGVYIR